MEVKILNSGSDGNSAILTDSQGNQLVLDCGISFEQYAKELNLTKCDALLVTHFHSDHNKSIKDFNKRFVDIFSPDNIQDNKLIELQNWRILPMELQHNITCFGFLIVNRIENKKIAYITDTTYIPNLPNNLDLLIMECNYDYEIAYQKEINGQLANLGFKNHLCKQQIIEYFNNKQIKPKNYIISHLSNSGLVSADNLLESLNFASSNTMIAQKGLRVVF